MILDKVRKTIKKYHLIKKGEKILVAVSGGPDSVALLYLLNHLKKELDLKLHIAHLDHKLRKDSYKDKEFVENLAKKLKIPITTEEVEVKRLAKKGSIEEVARNIRLNFLFKVAQKIKADKIALGHNLNDQAETVLMRLLRGSGLYGLAGILPQKEISGFKIIRPLIEISRREIEAFIKRKKIKPCSDITNFKDIYFRNKIRNRLIPFLEKNYNKNIKELLAHTAEIVGADYDYLMRRAEGFLPKKGNKLALKKFLKLHPALQRIILRLMIRRLKGNLRRISYQHLRELEDLIFFRPINSIAFLPQGLTVTKKKNFLIFQILTKA